MNVEPFILVDVDFLLGAHPEIQRLIEHLSRSQIMMPTVGSLGQLDAQHVSQCRAIERTPRGYSIKANPKIIRVIALLGLEDAKLSRTAKRESNADDGIPDPGAS